MFEKQEGNIFLFRFVRIKFIFLIKKKTFLHFLLDVYCKKTYTVFRQAFLLIQYSFICKQYFSCSDREYQYFFGQMVNKTAADGFNNIALFWS